MSVVTAVVDVPFTARPLILQDNPRIDSYSYLCLFGCSCRSAVRVRQVPAECLRQLLAVRVCRTTLPAEENNAIKASLLDKKRSTLGGGLVQVSLQPNLAWLCLVLWPQPYDTDPRPGFIRGSLLIIGFDTFSLGSCVPLRIAHTGLSVLLSALISSHKPLFRR